MEKKIKIGNSLWRSASDYLKKSTQEEMYNDYNRSQTVHLKMNKIDYLILL